MAISGDGSQANPWIVHNWEEFSEVNVFGSSGRYLKFADGGGIIDFNIINPDGYTSTSTFNVYPYIDGNGWVWRNLYLKGGRMIFNFSISNLNLLNVYSVGVQTNPIISSNVATNITLSGVFDTTAISNSLVPFYAANGTSRSSFNYKSRGKRFNCCGTSGNSFTFTQCRFNLDVSVSGKAYLCSSSNVLNNCLFTGQLYGGAALSASDCVLPVYDTNKAINNVLDVAVNSTVMQSLSNVSTINLYNTDKLTFRSTSSYVVGLNTAGLANADTIAATGFPIGV